MINFRLFGIPVTILPWFWATMGIIGALSLGLESSQDFLRLALFMLAGFISILVHELGHGLTIKKFGADTQIVLQSFGGFATYPRNRFSRLQDFLVTAAGPAIQLLLGGVIHLILVNTNLPETQGKFFLHILVGISIFWAVFNCVPIYPLDGGQMLNAILGPKRRKVTHTVGVIAAILLGLFALYAGFMFMAIFAGMFAYQNYQLLQGKNPQSPF
ncbi:MAG: site-2 protease family protein [Verrucomicrobiota bacterium]